jgi:hypothetical protein
MEPIYSDHSRLDERSLALHQLVAEKVRAEPALLDKARGNMRRWQGTNASPSPALAEWEQILGGPVNQVLMLLVERSERATRLRQSSPFGGILTEAERRAVYESHATRTYHSRRQPNLG